MSDFRRASVYIRDEYAGSISETDEGYSFRYDSNYLNGEKPLPVSITLPLSDEEYRSNVLFPFFDGLIPEGWLLDVASRNWKLSKDDRFGLLLVCCRDCIGDISIREGQNEV